jgi:hypothetical protein
MTFRHSNVQILAPYWTPINDGILCPDEASAEKSETWGPGAPQAGPTLIGTLQQLFQ